MKTIPMISTSDSKRKFRWATFSKSFCFLFITISIVAFALFYGVESIFNHDAPYTSPVIINLIAKGAYLWEVKQHAFAFLLTLSLFTSLVGSFWIAIIAPKYHRSHNLQLLIVPWIVVILTSPLLGVIAYWSQDSSFYAISYHAKLGWSYGWLSAIESFPINILSYTIVCGLLFVSKKLFSAQE